MKKISLLIVLLVVAVLVLPAFSLYGPNEEFSEFQNRAPQFAWERLMWEPHRNQAGHFSFMKTQTSEPLFLAGSDYRGRDTLARALYGFRLSLILAGLALGMSLSMGFFIGLVAAYFGGIIDFLLMRISEVVLAIPALYLLMALRGVLPQNVDPIVEMIMIVVALGCLGWAVVARTIRAAGKRWVKAEYIQAGRLLGASHFSLIRQHLIPRTAPVLGVFCLLMLPGYLLIETTLSFFGLGIHEPHVSLGSSLIQSLTIPAATLTPWGILPVVILFMFMLLMNSLAESFSRRIELQL